jgi:tetratricopeptide (TPR) repeat protein
MDIAERVIQRIEETGTQPEKFGGPANVYNSSISLMGYCKGITGQLVEGFTLCRESQERSLELGDLTTAGLSELYCGLILLIKGDAEAAGYLDQSIEHLEKTRFIQPLALAWSSLGFAHTLRGDPSEGLECTQKGLDMYKESAVTWHLSAHLFSLGWCRAASGDAEGARTAMEEALASARENYEIHMEGKTLLWLGRILAAPPIQEHGRAEQSIHDGIQILESLGARADMATGQLFLGELYADMGKKDMARDHLETACTLFREMGMDYWLETAEKQIGVAS